MFSSRGSSASCEWRLLPFSSSDGCCCSPYLEKQHRILPNSLQRLPLPIFPRVGGGHTTLGWHRQSKSCLQQLFLHNVPDFFILTSQMIFVESGSMLPSFYSTLLLCLLITNIGGDCLWSSIVWWCWCMLRVCVNVTILSSLTWLVQEWAFFYIGRLLLISNCLFSKQNHKLSLIHFDSN